MSPTVIQPVLWLFIAAIILSFIVIFLFSWSGNSSIAEHKLNQSEEEKKKNPDKVLPTFDVMFASILQAKEDDLRRIKNIYRVINIILFVGILIIVSSVALALSETLLGPQSLSSLWLVITAGIAITSSAVVMVFSYRSVLFNSGSYYQTIERLTWLGVSTKMFDNLSEDEKKNMASIFWEAQKSVFTHINSQTTSSAKG